MNEIDVRVLVLIKGHRADLSWREYSYLRERVFDGDAAGALEELRTLLQRKQEE